MSVLEWKSVELFKIIALASTRLPTITAGITAHCSNSTKSVNGPPAATTTSVLCDENGFVHVIFENEKKQKSISFKCNSSQHPVKLCALTTNNILATIQEDNEKCLLWVHIYDLRNLTKKDSHACISTKSVPTKNAATFIQVAVVGPENVLALGIGFEKGDILLHFGKISRDLLLNFRRHIIGMSAVNGIQFENNHHEQSSDSKVYMFVTCLDKTYCLKLNDKGNVESKFDLDNDNDNKKKIHNHCCTISQPIGSESFLVVGRDDAIFCFTRDGLGPCYAIGGEKRFISWIGHHLVVVVKNLSDFVVICMDVENKLIVFNKRIKDLLCVISISKNVYHIITKGDSLKNSSFNIYKLQEHNIANKVKLLIAKCMHDNALRILERSESDNCENAAHVRLQYGNNLLMRGSFNRAVSEFEQTIGVIKPYDIISKLLYSRHNVYLKQYLSKLLKTQHQTIDQKKLLETCIDREKLSLRIQQLWVTRNDSTHIADFKQLLVGSINYSSLLNATNQLENIMSVFQNTDEQEIFNFFLEYGRELLLVDRSMVLETVQTLVKNGQITNILPFLIIFSDHTEFCASLLADFIDHFSDRNENVHYYLLVLYLGLWREKKISTQKIQEYLKQTPLKSEMVLILCKANLFNIESKDQQDSVEPGPLTCHEESIELHIKANPKLANLLTVGPRSLLLILHKVCGMQSIQILDIRSLFIEKFKKNLNDAKSELQCIESVKEEIQKNGTLLSQFKLNPIEFRNSCCDICRQSLHMPSVYFLCQHSFHKECIPYNYNATSKEDATLCFLCNDNNKYNLVLDNVKSGVSTKPEDIIEGVSNVFASGIVKLRDGEQFAKTVCKEDESHNAFTSNTKEHPKNPFDENYDSNFNCF
ncbi:vacuolar protein sorting-associated protein 11 homolog [Drosophila innubila]|uniref:vacuolar protein sorting-associated protein 11 homolog n=1 Tax=Drosophila innubila TaxID=198719 RepID=UPI00148E8297|nr:vacuolar protein sorting-associated protein 11 homolog [Drosophila innubila]